LGKAIFLKFLSLFDQETLKLYPTQNVLGLCTNCFGNYHSQKEIWGKEKVRHYFYNTT